MYNYVKPFESFLIANSEPEDKFVNFFDGGEFCGDGFYTLGVGFSGYYFLNGVLYRERVPGLIPYGCVGNFSGIFPCDSGYKVFADCFGQGRVFFFECGDAWAVSNRYELILEWCASKKIGDVVSDAFILSWEEMDPFFSGRFTRRQDHTHIQLLPIQDEIYISNGRLSVKSRSVGEKFSAEGLSYEELINEGAVDLADNAKAILSSGSYDKFLLDLTGGFDSRLTLAAASKLNDYRERVVINTNDIPGSGDLDISLGMVSALGLKYQSEEYKWKVPVGLDSAYNDSISSNLGMYYTVGFSQWIFGWWKTMPVARLSGAGGEIYRAIYYRNWEGRVRDSSSLIDKLVSGSDLGIKRDRLEIIRDELNFGGDDFLEDFEWHYINYRCRTHYGMIEWDWIRDMPNYTLCMSKNLFSASRKLSAKDRGSEKLMLDATGALFPLLTCFPYSAKAGMNYSLHEPSDHRLKGVSVNGMLDVNSWKNANLMRSQSESKLKFVPAEGLDDCWKDFDGYIFKRIACDTEVILSKFPELEEMLIKKMNLIMTGKIVWNVHFSNYLGRISQLAYQINIYNKYGGD